MSNKLMKALRVTAQVFRAEKPSDYVTLAVLIPIVLLYFSWYIWSSLPHGVPVEFGAPKVDLSVVPAGGMLEVSLPFEVKRSCPANITDILENTAGFEIVLPSYPALLENVDSQTLQRAIPIPAYVQAGQWFWKRRIIFYCSETSYKVVTSPVPFEVVTP